MFNIGILAGRKAPHPIGEQVLTASSGTWTCPAGVTRVHVVLVGKGGDGVQFPGGRTGGGGGGLVYKNNIAVTPGESYAYTIDNSATQIFGLRANAGAYGLSHEGYAPGGSGTENGNPDGRYTGGAGATGASGYEVLGGSAARYDSNGTNGGGQGIGLMGIGSTGIYGRGGSSVYTGYAPPGGPGAIRIIWGDNRSFPSKAT